MEISVALAFMNSSLPSAAPSHVGTALLSGDHLARDLSALMEEIERTRDWFNAQMEAQLASLHQLQAAVQQDGQHHSSSMAALFQAAPASADVPALPPETGLPPAHVAEPAEATTVVLSPPFMTALNPQLEQATLQELNTALSRAFAEISSRGGMLA
jgi:hypothetical protein